MEPASGAREPCLEAHYLCYAMLCCAMLCCAMLCYAMLCYAIILERHYPPKCDLATAQSPAKTLWWCTVHGLFQNVWLVVSERMACRVRFARAWVYVTH